MRLLAILAAGLFAGLLTAADDKKVKDEEAIVGTWNAEKVETGDEQADKTHATDLKHTVTFGKDGTLVRLTTRTNGTPLINKEENAKPVGFKLDPTKTPKTIDVASGAKDELAGIYQLDGDTLKVCLAKTAGTARPTEFKGDKDKHIVMTLKRVTLFGTWALEKVESFVKDGKDGSGDTLSKTSLTLYKDGIAVEVDAKGAKREGTYKTDSATKPKGFDLTLDNATTLGVYELEGDTLFVCVNPKDPKTRPAECKADAKGPILMTWKRVKDK